MTKVEHSIRRVAINCTPFRDVLNSDHNYCQGFALEVPLVRKQECHSLKSTFNKTPPLFFNEYLRKKIQSWASETCNMVIILLITENLSCTYADRCGRRKQTGDDGLYHRRNEKAEPW